MSELLALDEAPRPDIRSACKVCGVSEKDIADNYVLVSPSGVAHMSNGWESTACGHDATGPEWWWPL